MVTYLFSTLLNCSLLHFARNVLMVQAGRGNRFHLTAYRKSEKKMFSLFTEAAAADLV